MGDIWAWLCVRTVGAATGHKSAPSHVRDVFLGQERAIATARKLLRSASHKHMVHSQVW